MFLVFQDPRWSMNNNVLAVYGYQSVVTSRSTVLVTIPLAPIGCLSHALRGASHYVCEPPSSTLVGVYVVYQYILCFLGLPSERDLSLRRKPVYSA